MLEVNNLSKSYNDNLVLDNISFSIKKGDIVYHRQYGDAKVKNIKADKITLDFKDGISRRFSLRVLMENNLIILIK